MEAYLGSFPTAFPSPLPTSHGPGVGAGSFLSCWSSLSHATAEKALLSRSADKSPAGGRAGSGVPAGLLTSGYAEGRGGAPEVEPTLLSSSLLGFSQALEAVCILPHSPPRCPVILRIIDRPKSDMTCLFYRQGELALHACCRELSMQHWGVCFYKTLLWKMIRLCKSRVDYAVTSHYVSFTHFPTI